MLHRAAERGMTAKCRMSAERRMAAKRGVTAECRMAADVGGV